MPCLVLALGELRSTGQRGRLSPGPVVLNTVIFAAWTPLPLLTTLPCRAWLSHVTQSSPGLFDELMSDLCQKGDYFDLHFLTQLCCPLKSEHFIQSRLGSTFWSMFFLLRLALIYSHLRFFVFVEAISLQPSPAQSSPVQSSPVQSNPIQSSLTQPNPYSQSPIFDIS